MNEPLFDILLKQDDDGVFDISFDENGDFKQTNSLSTSLVLSLFTERRALPSEAATPSFRRGWWGNDALGRTNFEIGSKYWLLEMAKSSLSSQNLAITYTRQALNWLVQEGFLQQVEVDGDRSFRNRSLSLNIVLTFNSQDTVSTSFNLVKGLVEDFNT